jgi:hypothetical protein
LNRSVSARWRKRFRNFLAPSHTEIFELMLRGSRGQRRKTTVQFYHIHRDGNCLFVQFRRVCKCARMGEGRRKFQKNNRTRLINLFWLFVFGKCGEDFKAKAANRRLWMVSMSRPLEIKVERRSSSLVILSSDFSIFVSFVAHPC